MAQLEGKKMNSVNPIVDDILKNGYLNEHIFGYFSIFYKNLKITENDISMMINNCLICRRKKNTWIDSQPPQPPKINTPFSTQDDEAEPIKTKQNKKLYYPIHKHIGIVGMRYLAAPV